MVRKDERLQGKEFFDGYGALRLCGDRGDFRYKGVVMSSGRE